MIVVLDFGTFASLPAILHDIPLPIPRPVPWLDVEVCLSKLPKSQYQSGLRIHRILRENAAANDLARHINDDSKKPAD